MDEIHPQLALFAFLGSCEHLDDLLLVESIPSRGQTN